MRNYLRLLCLSILIMFITVAPAVSGAFEGTVLNVEYVVPPAPPSIDPPDVNYDTVFIINSHLVTTEQKQTYAIPVDRLIPRPGWQSNSAVESFIEKRKQLLAQNKRS